MDYVDGIPALQTGDPISLTAEYTQQLRDFLAGFVPQKHANPLEGVGGTTVSADDVARVGPLVILNGRIDGVTYTSGTLVIARLLPVDDYRPSRYVQWSGFAVNAGIVTGLVQGNGDIELRWSSEPLNDHRIELSAEYAVI